jgi:hypothetical protein
MKNARSIIIVIVAIAIAYLLVFVSPTYSSKLINDFLVPILSILSGVLLAAVGVFLASLGNLYAIVHERANRRNADISKYLALIKGAVKETKSNVMLILCSIPIVVLIIYIKAVDIPFAQWPFTSAMLAKALVLSTAALTLLLLDFYAVYDCVKAMFRINDHYIEAIEQNE